MDKFLRTSVEMLSSTVILNPRVMAVGFATPQQHHLRQAKLRRATQSNGKKQGLYPVCNAWWPGRGFKSTPKMTLAISARWFLRSVTGSSGAVQARGEPAAATWPRSWVSDASLVGHEKPTRYDLRHNNLHARFTSAHTFFNNKRTICQRKTMELFENLLTNIKILGALMAFFQL